MKHTYNQGIIGNCAYIAHIDKSGNVVWLCWPDFDSPFVFGSMLDEDKGGHFSIQPAEPFVSKQYYLENTNVLCTEFETGSGRYRIVDFAPRFYQYERYFKPLMLFRKVELLEGNPVISVKCSPTYDYGETELTMARGSNHIRFLGIEQQLRLTTSVSLSRTLDHQPFILQNDAYFVLSYGLPLEAPLESTTEEFLAKTIDYWHRWVKYSTIPNFAQSDFIRSVLTLKMHQFEDTGAIIASSTTSLPEIPGQGRNWDYRYCWIRDTYYTLMALGNIGQGSELERYAQYVHNLALGSKERFAPVYSIHGSARLTETESNLAGYQGNQPVRIGNQACEHVQNDVYGQILLSLLPLYVDARFYPESSHLTSLELIYRLLRGIEATMDEGDAGLWEFRNVSQRHCYTFLFHWAGAKAARRIGVHIKDDKLIRYAGMLVDQAAAQIERCWSEEEGGYTQAIESPHFDASLLQLINMNYLDPQSERARSHLMALEKHLKAPGGLFYRYKHQDDFGMPRTTFLICAFWYVEALACVGRLDEARTEFNLLLEYKNHVDLFSEDVDHEDGSQWGNFPQTYSHVGLVNAAFRIARKSDNFDFEL